MSPLLFSVLKYALLLLLYLFIWLALRTVARGLQVPEAAPARPRPRPAERPPSAVVVRRADGRRLGSRRLTAPIRVGRSEGCDLRLEDAYVSQVHARLFPQDGVWFVEDLGSTNGTFLNGERVSAPRPLRAGDQVRVGTTVLELTR